MSGKFFRGVVGALVSVAALVAVPGATTVAEAALPTGTATLQGVVSYSGGLGAAGGAVVNLCAAPTGAQPGTYSCVFGGQSASTVADGNGAYSFSGIAGVRYQIAISPPNPPADPWAVLTIAPEVTLSEGVTTTQPLTIAQGGKVTGVAQDATGAPLANATVSVCGSGELICSSTTTDAAGAYTSRPLAGATARVSLPFVPAGSFSPQYTVTLAPAQTVTAPTLRVDPGGDIAGTVLDAGVAVLGATARVIGANGFATSVGDGTFTLHAPSGAQILDVTPPSTAPNLVRTTTTVNVATGASTPVTVTLARGASITSTFLSAGNGTIGVYKVPFVCPLGATFGLSSFQCIAPNGAATPPPGTANFSTGTVTGLPAGNYQVRGATTSSPGSGWLSPVASLDVAAGDTIACTFVIDFVTEANGSTSCTGATGTPPGGTNSSSVTPVVGGGTVTITSPAGTTIDSVTPVLPASLGALPDGVTMPSGAFSFRVRVPQHGDSADVTLTYPASTPTPNGYAKFYDGAWHDASSLVVAQDATSVTIHLVDGGAGDADHTADGVITDPGGPAVVLRYRLAGFQAPVNPSPVVNVGKAGRTYPVKFAVTDRAGAPVNDLAAVVSIKRATVACTALDGAATDPLEAEATSATALRVADGVFLLNWATPSTRGCYRLTVSFLDGQTLVAVFDLR